MANETVVVQAPPATLVQAGGRVAENIVSGLVSTPLLLVLVLVNMAYVGGAAWFLMAQENYRHDERVVLADLLKVCITKEIHP